MSGVSTFTCMGNWHGAPVVPVTRKEWEEARRKPSLAELCRLIEAGNEELKRRLPVWTPHCGAFKDNHRSIADALLPLPRLMLDFDEKGHSAEILSRSMELQKEGRWNILLVEESVRRGTHVLIDLPPGMSAEEAQKRFSADVGFTADAAVKDVARCIYLVTESHTLYVSDELFVSPQSNTEFHGVLNNPADEEKEKNSVELRVLRGEKKGIYPTTFKGIPYQAIIDEWFRRKGGPPVEGERNEKLFRLAVQLRCITDSNEARLLEILPRFGLGEQEMKAIIHSACVA
ncbi:MAG: hypothetical protein IJZ18_04225, partial [Mailhella sp.]|nr:hypothetical protein [Mailhella sp.]